MAEANAGQATGDVAALQAHLTGSRYKSHLAAIDRMLQGDYFFGGESPSYVDHYADFVVTICYGVPQAGRGQIGRHAGGGGAEADGDAREAARAAVGGPAARPPGGAAGAGDPGGAGGDVDVRARLGVGYPVGYREVLGKQPLKEIDRSENLFDSLVINFLNSCSLSLPFSLDLRNQCPTRWRCSRTRAR